LVAKAWWMVGLQVVYGVGFVALAARLLRPLSRAQEAKQRWEIRLDERGRRTSRILPRPPCDDRPMLWKERYTSQLGGVPRLLFQLFSLTLAVLIVCIVLEPAWYSLIALTPFGSHAGPGGLAQPQAELQSSLVLLTPLIFTAWAVVTAFAAATSVSGERE